MLCVDERLDDVERSSKNAPGFCQAGRGRIWQHGATAAVKGDSEEMSDEQVALRFQTPEHSYRVLGHAAACTQIVEARVAHVLEGWIIFGAEESVQGICEDIDGG